MIITNYLEYIYVIRELFDVSVWDKDNKYVHEADKNKFKDNKERIALQSDIAGLQQEITRLREEMKAAEDKKSTGVKFAEVKKKKQELVLKLKALTDNNRFNKLDSETKSCLCASYLLQKYLTSELAKSSALVKGKISENSIFLDAAKFKNSIFYQEAEHICDFVASYIERYPDKVKTPGYFKTLLGKNAKWNDVYLKAEEYFAKWRNEDISDPDASEMIRKSRDGVSVVKTYPKTGLQIVRLLTPEALDYEGKRMGHCVGGGSYDAGFKNGSSEFYSIRDLNNEEWRPHVTIQFSDGKIKQIKGRKDRMVVSRYINEARDFAAVLLGCESLDGIDTSRISDWRNIGYFTDVDGKLCDVYHQGLQNRVFNELELYGEDFRKIRDVGNVQIGTLTLKGEVGQETLDKVAQLKSLRKLKMKDAKFQGTNVLDFSRIVWNGQCIKKTHFKPNRLLLNVPLGLQAVQFEESKGGVIDLSSQNMEGIEQVIFNENINEIRLGAGSQSILENMDFSKYKNLRSLYLKEVELKGASFFDDLKNLEQLSLNKVTFSDVSRFVLSDFENLRKVDLDNSDLSGIEVLDLDAPNIEQLGLDLVVLGQNRAVVFEKNKKLKHLNLCYVTADLTRLRMPDSLLEIHLQQNDNFSSLIRFDNCHQMKKVTLGWGARLDNLRLEDRLPASMEEFFALKMVDNLATKIDLRRFNHLKKFEVIDWCIPAVKEIHFPESVEEVKVNGGSAEVLEVLDFEKNTALSNVVISLFSTNKLRGLKVNKNLEHLNLMGMNFGETEVLDLSHCHKLSTLHFQSCKFPKLKMLLLPASIKNCDLTSGSKCPEDVEISVEEGINPDVLKKITDSFGNNVVYCPKKSLLPVLFKAKSSSNLL